MDPVCATKACARVTVACVISTGRSFGGPADRSGSVYPVSPVAKDVGGLEEKFSVRDRGQQAFEGCDTFGASGSRYHFGEIRCALAKKTFARVGDGRKNF